ncbi:hypothetical protein PINS_up010761 [Pythium insidiosum]|nr:hypothetical protein PINS_up010761 [Pythium insidiosum]
MVKQIEQADLAKETVIQLPSPSAPTSPAAMIRSPRTAMASPRRRPLFGHSPVQRPATSSTPDDERQDDVAGRVRTRHAVQSRIALATAASSIGDVDASDSVARQWRLRFEDPDDSHEERGRVDRRQLLKDPAWGGGSPRKSPSRSAVSSPRSRRATGGVHGEDDDGDDENGNAAAEQDEDDDEGNAGDDVDLSSPLLLWGVSRDYILEYIRQSVMPTTMAT